MAPTIKNVALAGAGGNLGPSILKALMDSDKFNVTVLTRKAGSQEFPTGVTVKEVDYESLDSLTQALQGQDAVVNTTNSFDPNVATRVVDACVAAGVHRYIPSDFGLDPLRAHKPELPVFGIKALAHKHMQQKAQETPNGKFTWTIVATGAFLDWSISSSFMGVEVKKRKITFANDGENVIPYTMLEDIGKGTVGVLLHPDETANRIVYIHSTFKSQKQMAALAQEAIGGSWETTTADFDAIYENCIASIKKGVMTPDVMFPQIQYACTKKEYGQPWEKSDNALLGIKELSDDEIKAVYKSIASE